MCRLLIVAVVLTCAGLARAEAPGMLTAEAAVGLAMSRNRDVIGARLDLRAVEVERLTARLYPNPVLSYTIGNLVLGRGNDQQVGARPGFGDQTNHAVTVSEVIDIWAKRSARIRVADRSIEHQRLVLEDALREIAYDVRAAFSEVLREQSERSLASNAGARYDDTIRLTRARRAAGEISDTELKKVELEGLRYQNAIIDADTQLDLARQKLAVLLALRSVTELPPALVEDDFARPALSTDQLVERALQLRPDWRAVRADRLRAEAAVSQARREAFPDLSLGLGYTHSNFTVSGDNANTLSMSASLPLPIFDRNQGNIAHAHVDVQRADNEAQRIELQVRHEVAEAVRRSARSAKLVGIYEGGMLERADAALRVAEKSYKAGAVSLLELLEAQRTYLEVRGAYLRALHDYRQANIDVIHVVGGQTN